MLSTNKTEKRNRQPADQSIIDAFSTCHPFLNLFYFAVVLLFTMFNQHPVFICISYAGALSYSILLLGGKRTLRQSFLFTLPSLLIVALLNPLFNHYGVTMLYYVESSGKLDHFGGLSLWSSPWSGHVRSDPRSTESVSEKYKK